MRTRSEILDDVTRYTEKGDLVPVSQDQLRLLTLEVLVDIRDILAGDLTTSIQISKAMAEAAKKDNTQFKREH